MRKILILILSISALLPVCGLYAGDIGSYIGQKAAEKLAQAYPTGAKITITILTKDFPAWITADNAYVLMPSQIKPLTEITVADADNSICVKAAIEASVSVLSAARNIVKGQVLKAEDISLESADLLAANSSSYITAKADTLAGLKASRPIKAGSYILGCDLEKQPDVSTGSEVIITCEYNGISVSDSGRAEETGFAGDIIKVRNLKSKKLVMAKVVTSKIVVVEAR